MEMKHIPKYNCEDVLYALNNYHTGTKELPHALHIVKIESIIIYPSAILYEVSDNATGETWGDLVEEKLLSYTIEPLLEFFEININTTNEK